jgi:hypothetical protein
MRHLKFPHKQQQLLLLPPLLQWPPGYCQSLPQQSHWQLAAWLAAVLLRLALQSEQLGSNPPDHGQAPGLFPPNPIHAAAAAAARVGRDLCVRLAG